MELNTKVTGMLIGTLEMAEVNKSGQMVPCMRATGEMTKKTWTW